jgi:uncharacterized delta-60 repeat protein
MRPPAFLFILFAFGIGEGAAQTPGGLDSAFAANGWDTTAIGSADDLAFDIAVQPDGRIVTAGYSYGATLGDFGLVRHHADGSIDSTFGASGIVKTDIGGTQTDHCLSVAIQDDGKIIAAGFSEMSVSRNIVLTRYHADGSLDHTFDGDGKLIDSLGTADDYAWDILVQDDGRILVIGSAETALDYDFALIRFMADGTHDNSFGTGGRVTTDFSQNGDHGESAVVLPDGKIIVAGTSNDGSGPQFALAKYNPDGTLDNSFSTDGKVITPIGPDVSEPFSVNLQPDGRIVVAGWSETGLSIDLALVRYKPDGSLDSSFGVNGFVVAGADLDDEYAFASIIQPDGKIVIAGDSRQLTFDGIVVRFNSNGSIDSTFGLNGWSTTDFSGNHDQIRGIVMQDEGKFVAVGYSSNGTDMDFLVAQYLSGLNLGVLDFHAYRNTVIVYPNPVAAGTILSYSIQYTTDISISLVDLGGNTIQNMLQRQQQQPGTYQLPIDFRPDVAPGAYVILISSPGGSTSVKVIKP